MRVWPWVVASCMPSACPVAALPLSLPSLPGLHTTPMPSWCVRARVSFCRSAVCAIALCGYERVCDLLCDVISQHVETGPKNIHIRLHDSVFV